MNAGVPIAIRPPQRPILRDDRPNLRGCAGPELAQVVADALGGPRYRSEQVFEWVHRHRVPDFDAMTNLSRRERERLGQCASLRRLGLSTVKRASDGTRKLRLCTPDDHGIETVLIPNSDRGYTQCISSMVGCSLTCTFCATGKMGFLRSLAAWEIVDQVHHGQDLLAQERSDHGLEPDRRLTNLVFMGMGEPLHNYNEVRLAIAILTDPRGAAFPGRRITVSTAGLVPGIERFAAEGLGDDVGLAVSLNATTDAIRDEIMPINRRWNIARLLEAVKATPTPTRRRVTFEYVLLSEKNDTDHDARRLASLLGNLRCQVNVIPFNPHPGAPYRRPTDERIESFCQRAREGGLRVFLRRPRGDDIDAACGQLASRELP